MVKDLDDPAWELYDLDKDPSETNNLANTHQSLVTSMMNEYAAWANKVGVQLPKKLNKAE